jgi:hypothetical protein
MASLPRVLARLTQALGPHRADADVRRELDAHLALLEDEYVRRGMTPADAHRAARLALGGVTQTAMIQRDARAFRWLDDLAVDLRHTRRAMLRHWRSSLAAIVILSAVGTVNAALLGIADSVLFRRLPYADPARLYVMTMASPRSGAEYNLVPNRLLSLLQSPNDEISAAGLVDTGPPITVTTPDGPSGVLAMQATPSYFEVLGVRPFRGRLFVAADTDRPGQVAILSYDCWQKRFGGRDDVVGRSVALGDRTLDVVGVLPPGLFFPVVFSYVPEVFTAAPFPRAAGRVDPVSVLRTE